MPVTIETKSVAEGTGADTVVTYTITRTSLSESFSYRFQDAQDNTVYTARDNDFSFGSASQVDFYYSPLVFASGSYTTTLTAVFIGDADPESNETFAIEVRNDTSGQVVTAVQTIVNDDSASQLAIGNAFTIENDSGSTFIDFTVTRTGGTSGTASATYTVAGSGTNPASANDFNTGTYPLAGTVTFADGATTATIRLAVAGDYAIEQDETFTVTLSNPTNATIATATGTGTIANDDAAGRLVIGSPSVAEGGDLVFSVTREGGRGDVDFVLRSEPGTATAGVDYVTATQIFNFRNGQTTSTFTVLTLPDSTIEPDETVNVVLSNATPGLTTPGLTASGGVGTIRNDDFTGAFSVGDVTVGEGSQTGFFTVRRTGGLAAASVDYVILPGNGGGAPAATAGSDYADSPSGTVNFAAGQTSVAVPFTILEDGLVEQNETFRLVLSNPTNDGTLADAIGVATIVDNDAPAGSQFGTSNADILIANTPGGALVGYGGNDTYLVHNLGDQVIEERGGGVDIVYTDVSYNLGENEVEALSVADQRGTASINLIGNYNSQTIVGNYGDNVLNGGSGADTLIGLFGNDTYAVADGRIVIQEQDGQGTDTVSALVSYTLGAGVSVEVLVAQDRASTTGLSLTGNAFNQTIVGTAGADTLTGGGGTDVLIGGAGADVFVLGTNGVTGIADFATGDRIGLGAGVSVGTALDASEFLVGTAATTAEQRVIYDQASGQLFYDADGNGAGAAVLFALVTPGSQLSATDFIVVPATAG